MMNRTLCAVLAIAVTCTLSGGLPCYALQEQVNKGDVVITLSSTNIRKGPITLATVEAQTPLFVTAVKGDKWIGVSVEVDGTPVEGWVRSDRVSRLDDSGAAIAYFNRGVAYHNRNEHEAAIAAYSRAIALDGSLVEAHYYRGLCYHATRQFGSAERSFKTVLQEFPEFKLLDEAYFNLGVAQFMRGQAGEPEAYAAATATYQAFLAKFPQSQYLPQALFNLGESFYYDDKRAQALELYRQVVDEYPDNDVTPNATYSMGVTQENLGQFDAAGATYDLFLQRYPTHSSAANAVLRKGETLFAVGKYQEAADRYSDAAARDEFPSADYATLRQATALAQLEQYALAVVVYASVAEKFPQSQYAAEANLNGGKCAYLAKDYVRCRELFDAVIRTGGPLVPEATRWTARSWLLEAKPNEALAVVEKYLPALSDHPELPQLLLVQADALYEIPERRGESVGLFAALAEKYPQDPLAAQATYMAGFAAMNVKDYPVALTYAATFLQTYPDHALTPDVKYVAAETNLQLNRLAEAETLFAELRATYPQAAHVETWTVRQAVCQQLQKKYDEALATLTPILEHTKPSNGADPSNYILALLRGSDITGQLRQWDKSLDLADRAAREFPESSSLPDILVTRGYVYQERGQWTEALADYTRAVELAPNLAGAYHNRAIIYEQQRRWKDAIADITTELRLHPSGVVEYANLYNRRGLAWHQMGDYVQAINDYSEAIRVLPDSTTGAYRNRAASLVRLRSLDAAEQDYATALRMELGTAPQASRSAVWLGQFQPLSPPQGIGPFRFEGGHRTSADAATPVAWPRPRPSQPFDPVPTDTDVAQGDRQLFQGDLDQAIASYTRAIDRDPQSAQALGRRGAAHLANGDAQDALSDFRAATALDPQRIDYHFGAGVAQNKLGDKSAAGADFQTAWLLQPGGPSPAAHANWAQPSGLSELGQYLDELHDPSQLVGSWQADVLTAQVRLGYRYLRAGLAVAAPFLGGAEGVVATVGEGLLDHMEGASGSELAREFLRDQALELAGRDEFVVPVGGRIEGDYLVLEFRTVANNPAVARTARAGGIIANVLNVLDSFQRVGEARRSLATAMQPLHRLIAVDTWKGDLASGAQIRATVHQVYTHLAGPANGYEPGRTAYEIKTSMQGSIVEVQFRFLASADGALEVSFPNGVLRRLPAGSSQSQRDALLGEARDAWLRDGTTSLHRNYGVVPANLAVPQDVQDRLSHDAELTAALTRRLPVSDAAPQDAAAHRTILGFSGLFDEGWLCGMLGQEPGDLRGVWQDEQWQVKQVGDTRWLTVGLVGSHEAFLLYDATGESPEETVSNVKETLAKIRRSVGDEGEMIRVVLVGDPDDEDYAAHKAAIEADPRMQIVGEVDTRGKSENEIYDETQRAADQGDAQVAVRVRARRSRDDERGEHRSADTHNNGSGLSGAPLPGSAMSGFQSLDANELQQALDAGGALPNGLEPPGPPDIPGPPHPYLELNPNFLFLETAGTGRNGDDDDDDDDNDDDGGDNGDDDDDDDNGPPFFGAVVSQKPRWGSSQPLTLNVPLEMGAASELFLSAVGGVAFDGVARPADGLDVGSLALRYDPTQPDGQRLRVLVNGQEYVARELPDWQLVPIARYADSPYSAVMTAAGVLGAGTTTLLGQRAVMSLHPALANTLLGLRLSQADFVPGGGELATSLPTVDGQTLLGPGEQLPDLRTAQGAAAVLGSILRETDEPYHGYMISDRGATPTFSIRVTVAGTAGEFHVEDRLFIQVWKRGEEDLSLVSVPGDELRFVPSYEVCPLAELSEYVSQQTNLLERANPLAYRSLTATMSFSAFFRYCKTLDQPMWQAFLHSLEAVPQNVYTCPTPGLLLASPVEQRDSLDSVTTAAVTSDMKFVLAASGENACVYEVEPLRIIRTLRGHSQAVRAVALSPAGDCGATASDDGTAIIWDMKTGRQLRTLPGHRGSVRAIAFSPDGHSVLTGSHDGTARLWDVRSGELLREFVGHQDWITSVAFSPDGRRVFTGSLDRTAILWDVERGEKLTVFGGHRGGVTAVAFAPDGQHVLTGSADTTAILWNATTGAKVRTLKTDGSVIWSVAFSPQGRLAATGSAQGRAVLWDMDTGKSVWTFQLVESPIHSLAFTSDGSQLLLGSRGANAWYLTEKLWDCNRRLVAWKLLQVGQLKSIGQ